MSALLFRLLDVMRLRAGPQDLPSNWGVTALVALVCVLQGVLADRMLDGPGEPPRSVVALAVQVVASTALLWARRSPNRLPQTLMALTGTGFVFGLISMLLLTQATPQGFPPGLVLIWLCVFMWSLVVDAHIYRHALSITMSLGVLVAVLVFALNFMVIEMLFPA